MNSASLEAHLLRAVSANNFATVNEMLGLGANPNRQDRNGNTPLHLALSNANGGDIIVALVEANAGLDIPNNDQKTPLMVAIEYKFMGFASFLIKAGASLNPHIRNKNGLNAKMMLQRLIEIQEEKEKKEAEQDPFWSVSYILNPILTHTIRPRSDELNGYHRTLRLLELSESGWEKKYAMKGLIPASPPPDDDTDLPIPVSKPSGGGNFPVFVAGAPNDEIGLPVPPVFSSLKNTEADGSVLPVSEASSKDPVRRRWWNNFSIFDWGKKADQTPQNPSCGPSKGPL